MQMKHGNILLENFTSIFEKAETIHCRLALYKNIEGGPEWRAFRIFLDLSPEETTYESSNYNYGKVVFACGNIEPIEVVRWFQENQVAKFCGYEFKIDDLRDQVEWSRYSSHRRSIGFNRVPAYNSSFPFTIYSLKFKDDHFVNLKQVIDTREALIKSGCQSFTDYYTGLAHILHQVGKKNEDDPYQPEIIVRIVHKDAWLEKVFLGVNRVAVTVQGNQLEGTQLTVGGSGLLQERVLEIHVTQVFDLKHSNDRVWVLLTKDEEWLGERDLDLRYDRGQFLWENIDVTPDNIKDQISEWITAGESYAVEYKRQLSKAEDSVLKTIVAFANGQGGVLLLGVDDDQTICGVEKEFPQNTFDRYTSQITSLIHDKLMPVPDYQISRSVIQEHTIVAIQVFEGTEPPYTTRKNGSSIVYVRRNASTYPATPSEIREISLKALPPQSSGFDFIR